MSEEIANALQKGVQEELVPAVRDLGQAVEDGIRSVGKGTTKIAGDVELTEADATQKIAGVVEQRVGSQAASVDVQAAQTASGGAPSRIAQILDPAGPQAEAQQAETAVARIVTAQDGTTRLLNADDAVMDPKKFTEYALNPEHPVGGNKARVFAAATGFTRENADDLMQQIKDGVTQHEPTPGKVDQWGERFTVRIPVTGPVGSGTVVTGWIYKTGSDTPSLTTLLMEGMKK